MLVELLGIRVDRKGIRIEVAGFLEVLLGILRVPVEHGVNVALSPGCKRLSFV